ncbi:hypothetical protein BUALT_Bualt17G0018300 [Buddleja alternifolia]|uniref:Uncharacterized protein n=1 Tax=Buddleja alternifolia TaxID=168488 RepID=A0AAV6W6W0_9LAMI|nr:hypothetical protein BUALT_Bualt17G0018300 [Buddleja alternifolia]
MAEEEKLFDFMFELQPWAKVKLRRQGVKDLLSAYATTDLLVDFRVVGGPDSKKKINKDGGKAKGKNSNIGKTGNQNTRREKMPHQVRNLKNLNPRLIGLNVLKHSSLIRTVNSEAKLIKGITTIELVVCHCHGQCELMAMPLHDFYGIYAGDDPKPIDKKSGLLYAMKVKKRIKHGEMIYLADIFEFKKDVSHEVPNAVADVLWEFEDIFLFGIPKELPPDEPLIIKLSWNLGRGILLWLRTVWVPNSVPKEARWVLADRYWQVQVAKGDAAKMTCVMRIFGRSFGAFESSIFINSGNTNSMQRRKNVNSAGGRSHSLAVSLESLLKLLESNKSFEVRTYASDWGTGSVLVQDKHPVAFESHKLKDVDIFSEYGVFLVAPNASPADIATELFSKHYDGQKIKILHSEPAANRWSDKTYESIFAGLLESLLDRLKIHPTIHVTFLKKYHEDALDETPKQAMHAPSVIRQEFDKKVHRILKHHTKGKLASALGSVREVLTACKITLQRVKKPRDCVDYSAEIPDAAKYKEKGPILLEDQEMLFSNVVATRSSAWTPSSGILPQLLQDELDNTPDVQFHDFNDHVNELNAETDATTNT